MTREPARDRGVVLIAVTGALIIATSATLVRLSGVAPATSAFYRCLYAVPPLVVLAWLERRRLGPMATRERLLAWAAGIFFGLDLVFWHHSIGYVGAGPATVLGNLQVFVVAFAAWALFAERPSRALMIGTPVVFAGVVLISGLFDSRAYGENPGLGVAYGVATSLTYAAFMLIMRAGSGGRRRVAGPLAHATLVAALLIAAVSPLSGGADFTPSWPAHAWLLALALGPQVGGWMLITYALPRQPAALTALLLLIQPIGSLAVSAAVLGERPSPLQLAGCAVIALGVLYGSRRDQPARSADAQDEQVPKTSTV
ncbi:drug/metabolite transporter (DMT)-like permease [Thermocatellispora tengchongensis]|uniref:Drug/metabolite transporter (DMT)-like permease n=1 Tax=Thermocatellispora tengchongensis TaxID=1073253 RepID=A0A840P3E0_9ACTN|nr:DMT family transporter [Thermocatellispora tengchongensis]MBB5133016.1 drug/metabolite transporter (DMT)-like permease [Thermocatellispora tengchongensis]